MATPAQDHQAPLSYVEIGLNSGRKWYIFQGILFILAGLAALVLPAITVVGVNVLLAALLIVSGGYQTYHGAVDKHGWLFFSGLLSLGVGLALAIMPFSGAIAIATLIAVFLLIEGVLEIVISMNMRFNASWGWMMASGVLSLLLGAIFLFGWPQQTLVLAGILIGINFIFYGAAILAIVASQRKA